jgi:hypothetical protein
MPLAVAVPGSGASGCVVAEAGRLVAADAGPVCTGKIRVAAVLLAVAVTVLTMTPSQVRITVG